MYDTYVIYTEGGAYWLKGAPHYSEHGAYVTVEREKMLGDQFTKYEVERFYPFTSFKYIEKKV